MEEVLQEWRMDKDEFWKLYVEFEIEASQNSSE